MISFISLPVVNHCNLHVIYQIWNMWMCDSSMDGILKTWVWTNINVEAKLRNIKKTEEKLKDMGKFKEIVPRTSTNASFDDLTRSK